jgi:hypothetical protein
MAQGRRTRRCRISGSCRGDNRRLADVAARTVLDPNRTRAGLKSCSAAVSCHIGCAILRVAGTGGIPQ